MICPFNAAFTLRCHITKVDPGVCKWTWTFYRIDDMLHAPNTIDADGCSGASTKTGGILEDSCSHLSHSMPTECGLWHVLACTQDVKDKEEQYDTAAGGAGDMM